VAVETKTQAAVKQVDQDTHKAVDKAKAQTVKDSMKVSVNILTWNCLSTLHDTLYVLSEDLKGIESEVIVIDNGSKDGCADMATIKNRENMGVSVGKNQGIDASKGDYIFMLDGDIVPVPNSINCLLAWLEHNIDAYAIGFYPNKFTDQRNKNGQKHSETYCHSLYEPKRHSQVIAFYGLFKRSMFNDFNIRFPENGPFTGVGYGWEDSDLYMQMRENGIHQMVAGINKYTGKYYHEINSSIRLMGQDQYTKTSRDRHEAFQAKWGDKIGKYYA